MESGGRILKWDKKGGGGENLFVRVRQVVGSIYGPFLHMEGLGDGRDVLAHIDDIREQVVVSGAD